MIPHEQQEWGGRTPFEQEERSGRSRSNRLLQLIGGERKKGAQRDHEQDKGRTDSKTWMRQLQYKNVLTAFDKHTQPWQEMR